MLADLSIYEHIRERHLTTSPILKDTHPKQVVQCLVPSPVGLGMDSWEGARGAPSDQIEPGCPGLEGGLAATLQTFWSAVWKSGCTRSDSFWDQAS